MSVTFLTFLAGCLKDQDDAAAHNELKMPGTFVKPAESYFVVSETAPLKSCTEPHAVNPAHATRTTYASPADFCSSGDNYSAVEFDFLCKLEDCRVTMEGNLWCPEIPVRNCAAFRCVTNRSERAKKEFFQEQELNRLAVCLESITWPLSPHPECF